jgi:osmoprotectant transport system ATP-binding protein
MGDLVAVMQTGGHLAQIAAPSEILADPASEFVARFVGADRGLKRLALVRVRELRLRPAVTATRGDDAAAVHTRAVAARTRDVLLVDERNRPLGWLDERRIGATGTVDARDPEPAAPLLDTHTTLRDALSMLLEAGVQTGIVVEDAGSVQGLLTIDMIMDRIQAG